jgi:hypothetical protein
MEQIRHKRAQYVQTVRGYSVEWEGGESRRQGLLPANTLLAQVTHQQQSAQHVDVRAVGVENLRIDTVALVSGNVGLAAEQYERELRQALLDGSRKERREAPRFAAFVEEYLQTYAEPNNKYSTVISKKSIFKHHLVPAFGLYKIDEITLREIEGYKARKLATGLSPKSVNNHLTILRKTLSVAVDWELL